MDKSYRIINVSNGRVKMVGKAIFEDVQLLSQMGFIQQDIVKEKEVKIVVVEEFNQYENSDIINEVANKPLKKQPNKVK